MTKTGKVILIFLPFMTPLWIKSFHFDRKKLKLINIDDVFLLNLSKNLPLISLMMLRVYLGIPPLIN